MTVWFKILWLIYLLVFPALLYTQDFDQKKELTYEMTLMIKQLNQFMDRFNYEKDVQDQEIDSIFKARMSRAKYISTLFNKEDKRFGVEDEQDTLWPSIEMNNFITDVVDQNNPQLLHYSDNKLFAVARSMVTLNGLPQELSLVLQLIVHEDFSSQWFIIGVIDSPFNMEEKDNNEKVYIPPNSNETNFIRIGRLLDDTLISVTDLSSPVHEYDPLSVFWYHIENDLMEFDYVQEITYFFFNVSNWVFTVEHYNRNNWNSGWLISNLYSVPELDKPDFFRNNFLTEPINQVNNTNVAFSLEQYCPFPGNQGQMHTSSAWAAAYYAMSMNWAISNGITSTDLITDSAYSPAFVFNFLSSEDSCHLITDINKTLYFLKHTGTVRMNVIDNECLQHIPDHLYKDVSRSKIEDYTELFRNTTPTEIVISSVKQAILKKDPVLVEFNAPVSFLENVNSIWLPLDIESGNVYHTMIAITVIGFDDQKIDTGAFEVVFSKGKEWGENGKTWIKYSSFLHYARKGYVIQ